MAKIAFLGLGVMGYPMAGHLVKAGHEVTVYNRTFAKAEAWAKEHGGGAARTPAEAANVIRSFPEDDMAFYRVSPRVNNVRNDDAECIVPLQKTA